MNKNINIEKLIALLMSLMMLASLFPAAASTEFDMTEYPEDVFEETEQIIHTWDEPWDDWAEDAPAHEPDNEAPPVESIESVIAANGYVYVMTAHAAMVYRTPEMDEPIFNITRDAAILLATEYRIQNSQASVKAWLITEAFEVIRGYVAVDALADTFLRDEEAIAMTEFQWAFHVPSDAGEQYAFVIQGEKPGKANVDHVEEVIPEEPVSPEGSGNGEPAHETENHVDSPTTENPAPEVLPVTVGSYVAVTPETRAFQGIDETASDKHVGDLCLGVFVNDAVVQVMAIEQDSFDRIWYKVRYTYGYDYADGTLAWVEDGFTYVLAPETDETTEQRCSITDYAPASSPLSLASMQIGIMAATTPMVGFTLKSISAPISNLNVGQTGVHGHSERNNTYVQIASLPGHGTIFATPHFLNGYVVYCLEHNLPGPGDRIDGGGEHPTGPYVIVDWDGYRTTPGASGVIYSQQTLHAIAWVMRHTYPFMVLNRTDADNEIWSRVAGQFAIREVVKQMEGPQHVRNYWQMENFVRNAGQAPAVYLTYARWLAENGIARGRITGDITVTNRSVTHTGGVYTGTATLTTDADLIRIRRSVGTVTGHTAGQDSTYYYLHSGNTITVSSTSSPFTIEVESVNSDAQAARFLIGIPSVSIQKVLIPVYGYPYPMKSVSIVFEIPHGSISVTKRAAQTGSVLPGAVFELLNSAGVVVQTQTTGSNGIVTFVNLQPGSYAVRERTAPEGYYVATSNTQNVTVTAGNVSNVTFTNNVITGKVRIVKKDQLTKEPLSGAEFTVTRLSAPASHNGAGVGQVVAVITTDANGIAETDWLEWGTYRVEETKVPLYYVDNRFSTVIEAYEHGKTYVIEVENEPAKGWIRLLKTDRQNGNSIEGVRFDIYYNDQYGEGFAGTMVTGKDGIAISEPLRKGRYIVKEHGETAGYVFEIISLDATVKSDETTELQATNRHVTVKLRLYKRDVEKHDGDLSKAATRGDGVLIGAEFQMRAGEDIKDRQGNVMYTKGAVVVESLKTAGENVSVATDELWPGLYEIVELTPPVGYQPSAASIFVDARSAAMQSTEAIVTYEGLVTNKIHYGALAIVKFLGDNREHTGGGTIETPEIGAEFEVYLKSAGSYENARDVERDHLITDRYGRAQTKPLPYGVYVLRQVVGKEGHAMMPPIDFMIDGTEDLKAPPTLILNNQARLYRLRIIKIDEETGNTIALANTSFRLRDGDGNVVTQSVNYPAPMQIDTFLTNANGEVTLPETVAWGHYSIEEVQSPEGYLIRSEAFSVFVGHAEDATDEVHEISVEFPNEPVKGHIVLDKKGLQLAGFEMTTDAHGNEYHKPIYEVKYLEGAVFEVRAAEDIVGKEGTVWYWEGDLVDTITTTASGSDRTKELPLGKYWVVEIQAPVGYIFESAPHEANLVFVDNQTARVEVTVAVGNEYLPAQITLKKEKEITHVIHHNDGTVRQIITNAPGEGFVFGLYNDQDIHCSSGTLMADTLVATGTTDVHGNLTISGHYPHGRYYFKELSTPTGWKLNPERFGIHLDPTFDAEAAGVIRVSLPHAVHNELIYTPMTLTKTDITGEKTLPGCMIEVTNSDGEVIYRAYTDENGHIPDIPITPGVYTFREVLAPEGYALNEAVMTFTVDEDGNITGDSTIRDDYTHFSLLKQGENHRPLAGVQFALLKEDGSLLYTAVTDENGLVTFEKVPYGTYTIVETKPLPGYLKNDTVVQLTVDGLFTNPSEPVATLINRRMRITGMKVDTSGKHIPGVDFSLINATTGEIVESVTSNDRGEFVFTKLDYGEWIIRETKVPEGYIQMEDVHLRVDESWAEPVFVLTCTNIPNHYAFMKTDHKDNPLAGVKFTLEDADGNVLREMVSGEDGIVRVTDLTPGAYVIREIETVEGFIRTDKTIKLVIDENYVVPEELFRLVNYPGIPTGFEFTMTPLMWVGVALVLAAVALGAVYGVKNKKKKGRRRLSKKPRRI